MRNPTSSNWKVGWLRRRTEARQLQRSSNHPPPRSTQLGHELVTAHWPVTSTVEEVTGAPARTFRTWVTDHAGAFRDTMKR